MERMLKTKKKYLRAGFQKSIKTMSSVRNLDGLIDSYKTELMKQRTEQPKTMPKLPNVVETRRDDKKAVSMVIKRHARPVEKTKMSVFEEFVWLCRESHDYIDYYSHKFIELPPEILDFKLKSGKHIILLLLKKHFEFFQRANPQLISRVLMSLSINPLNDFSPIDWQKYTLIKKLINSKDLEMPITIRFLTKMFFSTQQTISRQQFCMVMKLICQEIDRKEALLGNRPLSEVVVGQQKSMTKEQFKQYLHEQEAISAYELIQLIFRCF